MSADETSGGYTWDRAKRPSASPRPAGVVLERHIRQPGDDLEDHEIRLREDLTAASERGDAALIYAASHRLASHLEALGALDQAEILMRDAVSASNGNSQCANEHLAALNDYAIVLARLGQSEDAIANLMRASKINGQPRSSLTQSVLRNRGLMDSLNGDRVKAFELWDKAFRTAREVDDPAASGEILNNVAVVQLLAGENDHALQLFNRATLLAQRGGDIRGLAFAYNNLGLIFSGPPRGDHFAAIPFVEMALALTESIDTLASLYILNNNIIIYEQAHLEPARKLRGTFAEILKSFSSVYPNRAHDIERAVYSKDRPESAEDRGRDAEWAISGHLALLRSFSRCGVQA